MLSLGVLLFSEGRQKGSGSRERGGRGKLGGVEIGETIVRIYRIRGESIFNKRRKKITAFK